MNNEPTMNTPPQNGWWEWSKWVLKNIEAINLKLDDLPTRRDCLSCTETFNKAQKGLESSIGAAKQEMKVLEGDIHNLEREIAVLKTELKLRAGIWGAIGAAIPVLILVLLKYLPLGGP